MRTLKLSRFMLLLRVLLLPGNIASVVVVVAGANHVSVVVSRVRSP